jgi:hypothetical protein
MTIKLKWELAYKPTGRFSFLEKREWPRAHYQGTERIALIIYCEDAYSLKSAKTGSHQELSVRVADYSVPHGFQWRTLRRRFATLTDAKEAATKFLEERPVYWPSTNRK